MTVEIKNCPVKIPLEKLKTFARPIQFIAIHCSASSPKSSENMGVAELNAMHIERGFACIGYHYVIKRNGEIVRGRPKNVVGAHVEGFNSISLGVCLIGGIDTNGKPINNFTDQQFASLKVLLLELQQSLPRVVIQGHRDFSPDKNHDGQITQNEWLKSCPCFDVKPWWQEQSK